MSDSGRIWIVVLCCFIAALTPFIAGMKTASFGLLPLGFAVWLLSRSGMALAMRAAMVVAAAALTVGLIIGLLILITAGSGD